MSQSPIFAMLPLRPVSAIPISDEAEDQPTRKWLELFWRYLYEFRADLACFEDWPLLPCAGGVLRRMIEGSSVVDMVRASNELRECLATLGCHALDASIVTGWVECTSTRHAG